MRRRSFLGAVIGLLSLPANKLLGPRTVRASELRPGTVVRDAIVELGGKIDGIHFHGCSFTRRHSDAGGMDLGNCRFTEIKSQIPARHNDRIHHCVFESVASTFEVGQMLFSIPVYKFS